MQDILLEFPWPTRKQQWSSQVYSMSLASNNPFLTHPTQSERSIALSIPKAAEILVKHHVNLPS